MKYQTCSEILETGDDETVSRWLLSQIEEQPSNDELTMYRMRASALARAVAPMLVYMRDVGGLPLTVERIRFAMELATISTMAFHKRLSTRNIQTGVVTEISGPDVPPAVLAPLESYLRDLPEYDVSAPHDRQATGEALRHHNLALFYFSSAFAISRDSGQDGTAANTDGKSLAPISP